MKFSLLRKKFMSTAKSTLVEFVRMYRDSRMSRIYIHLCILYTILIYFSCTSRALDLTLTAHDVSRLSSLTVSRCLSFIFATLFSRVFYPNQANSLPNQASNLTTIQSWCSGSSFPLASHTDRYAAVTFGATSRPRPWRAASRRSVSGR